MAKNKLNKSWVRQHLNDPFVKQAQKDGYRARAAYKLKEIDEIEKLIHPGQLIVDLGSTPGSWSQYARERLREAGKLNGCIIGLDLLPMEPIEGVHFIQGDFREDAVLTQLEEILGGRKVDLVLSDMAPNLSGIPSADAARVEYIIELALDFAHTHLKPSGAFVAKCFHSAAFEPIVTQFRAQFAKVSIKKPKASRDKSAEFFLVGRSIKANDLKKLEIVPMYERHLLI